MNLEYGNQSEHLTYHYRNHFSSSFRLDFTSSTARDQSLMSHVAKGLFSLFIAGEQRVEIKNKHFAGEGNWRAYGKFIRLRHKHTYSRPAGH
jgi:hypothetical protein